MKCLRKPCFTLFELLLVILLLGIGMSMTAIQIKKAYDEQQFLSEVEQVRSHLQMVQDLMLVAAADAYVKFGEDSGALCYQVKLQNKTIDNKLFSEIVEGKYQLKKIQRIEFEGFAIRGSQEIELQFFSQGLVMTAGKLVFSPSSELKSEESYEIVLAGYPKMIESQRHETFEGFRKENTQLAIYPKELFADPHEKNR